MPRRDRTGPMGMGPMTGRAAGDCAGYGMQGNITAGAGFGFQSGFGRSQNFWCGRGHGRGFTNRASRFFKGVRFSRGQTAPLPTSSPEAEKQFLQTQAEALKIQLDEIKSRLDELASPKTQ